jgi:flavin-binding protein dodecin
MSYVGRLVLVLALVPSILAGQESRPSVIIAGTTPKAIGEAMRDALAEQKFKLGSAGKKRIVLVQPRGNVAQSTGEIMRVRLEVGFGIEALAEGLRVTLADETLIAERGVGTEQRRPQDLDRNRQSYQNLLDQVKAVLEPRAGADTTRSDAIP